MSERGALTIGVDIGGTKVDAVLLDERGTMLARVRTPTAPGVAGVLDTVHDTVRRLAADANVSLADVVHVGAGIPGIVDATAGVVHHAVNLNIREVALAERLTERLGVPVVIDNDVNAAALGAAALLQIAEPLGYLNLGTGLAAGIVVDGRLWRGARGGAGEIGHIPTNPSGLQCPCGQRGCLETVASGAAIAARWPSASPRPAVELFDQADARDARAQIVRGELVEGVAAAIRLLVLTFDVERVVVGGGLRNLGDRLIQPVFDTLRRWGAGSAFIASRALIDRVQLLPPATVAAPVGAALLGVAATPDVAPTETA